MRETGRKRGLSGLGSGFRVHKVGIIETIGLKSILDKVPKGFLMKQGRPASNNASPAVSKLSPICSGDFRQLAGV